MIVFSLAIFEYGRAMSFNLDLVFVALGDDIR